MLIAEDDDDIRDTLAEVVRDAGYDVAVAPNGKVALESMRDQPPCVLLLDLMMPLVDGWQVVDRMQRDAELAAVPVCVLSAFPERAPAQAICVLGKPVDLDRLLETIEQHCGAHAGRGDQKS